MVVKRYTAARFAATSRGRCHADQWVRLPERGFLLVFCVLYQYRELRGQPHYWLTTTLLSDSQVSISLVIHGL